MSNSNEIQISKASVIGGYEPIASPMKIELEVTGNPSKSKWVNPRLQAGARGATYLHSFFVNLKAIDARKIQSMLDKFNEHGGEEMPISEFKFGLTKEIIVHTDQEAPQLPISGDKVICQIDFAKKDGELVTDENGANILEVRNIIIPEAKKSSGTSWDVFTTNKDKRKAVIAQEEEVASDDEQF